MAEDNLLSRALGDDPAAMMQLVKELRPWIQEEVAKCLWADVRGGSHAEPTALREQMEGLVQDVFWQLLDRGGRELKKVSEQDSTREEKIRKFAANHTRKILADLSRRPA